MTNRDDSFELTYQSNHEYATSVIQGKTSTLIYFHFKTPTKKILLTFRIKLMKRQIWQKSSAKREFDFTGNLFLEKCNNASTKSTNILIHI